MHVRAEELARLIHTKVPNLNRARLAERSGVSVRSVRRIMNGEVSRVDVDVAERLIDAAGGHLFEVGVREEPAKSTTEWIDMITLEQVNQLRHLANGLQDGDGESALTDMLEALIPYLPPMVGLVVSEFLATYQNPDPQITAEDIHDPRPGY